MDRKCGSEIPEPVHSSKDHVYVHMLTDHSVSGRGFRLEWLVDGKYPSTNFMFLHLELRVHLIFS